MESRKTKEERSKKDSLLIALRKGQAGKVGHLLDSYPDELSANDEADPAKNTLLQRAARYGHPNVVHALLDRGADPNKANKFGMTSLHHAAVGGDPAIVECLITKGRADPDWADDAGRYPIHWAAGHGFLEVVKVLVEVGKAKCEISDKDGWTPLHRCCQEAPPPEKKKDVDPDDPQPPPPTLEEIDAVRAEIASVLLDRGARPNVKEPKGHQTPLHLAAMNGYAKTVDRLVREGALIDAKNKIEKTPLLYAINEKHFDTMKVLVEAGADLEVGSKLHFDWTPLHFAIMEDNVDMVKYLLEKGAKEAPDGAGRSPEQIADEHFKLAVLTYLKTR